MDARFVSIVKPRCNAIPRKDVATLQRSEPVKVHYPHKILCYSIKVYHDAAGGRLSSLGLCKLGVNSRDQVRSILMDIGWEQPEVLMRHVKSGLDLLNAPLPDEEGLAPVPQRFANDCPLF